MTEENLTTLPILLKEDQDRTEENQEQTNLN